jgi:hypothetical protein
MLSNAWTLVWRLYGAFASIRSSAANNDTFSKEIIKVRDASSPPPIDIYSLHSTNFSASHTDEAYLQRLPLGDIVVRNEETPIRFKELHATTIKI